MKFDIYHLKHLAERLNYKPDSKEHKDNLTEYCNSERMIAIAEAFRELEQRAESAEANLAEEQRVNSKLREDRAGLARECNAFETKLAEETHRANQNAGYLETLTERMLQAESDLRLGTQLIKRLERQVLEYQAQLAELAKQEHYVEVIKDGPMTFCHWMKPASELPDGAKLFTRAAPAAVPVDLQLVKYAAAIVEVDTLYEEAMYPDDVLRGLSDWQETHEELRKSARDLGAE